MKLHIAKQAIIVIEISLIFELILLEQVKKMVLYAMKSAVSTLDPNSRFSVRTFGPLHVLQISEFWSILCAWLTNEFFYQKLGQKICTGNYLTCLFEVFFLLQMFSARSTILNANTKHLHQ